MVKGMVKDKRTRSVEWYLIRNQVHDRDERQCQYCGQPATSVDHIIPYSKGGPGVPSNLVACCDWCNMLAADKEFSTFGEKQRFLASHEGFHAVGPRLADYLAIRCLGCGDQFIPIRSRAVSPLCPWCIAHD
jgi:hypothetical protein